ncbi:heme exporter protein CcmB [Oleiphilus messinensis]|uniref:Heme exporter protein B n=1 Tax=Oleiphilus messinensis TaxID=141451 RepID=A0A1Y0IAR9_9GAMM|nr:heme exporter protein CcmB [Oleiphilus messinensis]ARU57259.1 heme exporter protein CcmB [Oleiphilus messinensis]
MHLKQGPQNAIRSVLLSVLKRDLILAFRRRQDLINPIVFFLMVVTLFPLGVSPEKSFLQQSGAGIVWVAALLATLLSLDSLFRADFEDGSLEQLALSPHPLFLIVLVKVFAHWIVTGVPLLLFTPVLGIMLHLNGEQIYTLMLTLLLGTPVLSLIGSIGAALTVGLRVGGVLITLLILPLYIPVLIFGTGTVEAVSSGVAVTGHLSILAAMLAFAVVMSPVAASAALRISLSS